MFFLHQMPGVASHPAPGLCRGICLHLHGADVGFMSKVVAEGAWSSWSPGDCPSFRTTDHGPKQSCRWSPPSA